MTSRDRRLAVLWVGLFLLLAPVGLQPRAADALFGDTLAVGGNTFTTGVWAPIYYLHNNPTPPTANTLQQANLPLDTLAPSAVTLYNYDTNRDSFPGRLVLKGGSGGAETDLTKYQNWRSAALASPLALSGVSFEFWSAIKDFGQNKAGSVQVFLRDFNPATSTYTEISNATLTASNWQAGSATWVYKAFLIPASYTLAAGRILEVKLIVLGGAGDDMWFAYDTTAYSTRLALP